tara:strand:- start:71 stop:286 length:216 start_codon:yes stop_codon:yes gene_type:complete
MYKRIGIIGGSNVAIELQYYINEEINKMSDTRKYIKTIVINDDVNTDTDTVFDLYENPKGEEYSNSLFSLI